MGWLIPSDPSSTLPELQRQYRAQVYLWLKDIFPPARVLKFRERYFRAFADLGLLKPGTVPVDGIGAKNPSVSGQIRKMEAQVVRCALFEAFCFMPEIVEFCEAFLGGTHTCTSAKCFVVQRRDQHRVDLPIMILFTCAAAPIKAFTLVGFPSVIHQ